MNDQDKSKAELIAELKALRRQVAGQEHKPPVCSGSEVADLKLAQDELQQACDFNDRLIASMNDGLSVLDADGVHVEVNDAFCRMTGFARDELIGVGPPHPYWPPEHCAYIQQTLEEVARGESHQYEFMFMRKNGERFPVIVAPSRTTDRDGSGVHFFATIKDISERKAIEERLRESERRLLTLISNLPGAVYRCKADEHWTIEFLSDGYYALTGFQPAELIGRPGTRHHGLIHVEDRQREYELVQQAVAERKPFEVQYRLRTASGEERWLWERGQGVFSEAGELLAIEGFTTDITAQKEAEFGLRKVREELEQCVALRTAELSKANEELRIFRTFAQTSGEGFGMANTEGRIVYTNPALARLVGERDPEDVFGKQPSDYFSEDYQKVLETEILPVLARGEVWRGELTMVSVTGEQIPVLQTSFTLLDDSNEPIRRGVVVTDLRKVKEAEESLQNSLKELQAVYDGLPEGLVLSELPSREIRRVNPAICRMLRYSQDELLSMTVDQIHPPAALAQVDEATALMLGGKHVEMEAVPMQRGDGSVFCADVSATVIHIEGRSYSVRFFRDITQQLEVEEERRKSEARYKALVDSSPDAIVMCDLNGRITFASPQAVERHRVSDASDLVGRLSTELVVEQDRALILENIRRLMESDGPWVSSPPSC